jgi:type I restriction enzyme S subunit
MTAISGKDVDALAFFEREHPEQYAELKPRQSCSVSDAG